MSAPEPDPAPDHVSVRWPELITALVLVALALLVSLVPSEGLVSVRARFSRLPLVAQGAAFAVLLVLLDAVSPPGVAPFIYFQF